MFTRLCPFIILVGCLTPIDFSVQNIGGRLVISGQISTVLDECSVYVGRTSDESRLPKPESGALVEVFGDDGSYGRYMEDGQKPGTYRLSSLTGIPGVTYFIRVTLPAGGSYESVPEKLPASAGQLSTFHDFVVEEALDGEGILTEQRMFKLYANIELPDEFSSSYFKWTVDETYQISPTNFPDPFGAIPPSCFVTQSAEPQRINLLNGHELSTRSIKGMLLASRPVDQSFFERHSFTINQTGLTIEAYEYWRKVSTLANVGSIFDAPPAEITGNLQNSVDPTEKIYGYFQAVNQVSERFFMTPYDLPYILTFQRCDFDGIHWNPLDYPPRCRECLLVANSSYSRPYWF